MKQEVQYVVVAESTVIKRMQVQGPFPTREAASGYGFSRYGPLSFGVRLWSVVPLEAPIVATAPSLSAEGGGRDA